MPTIKLRIGLPSKRTMGSLCICGALASISGLAYMRWRLEDRVRQSEYYQMAIQQLRQHSGAVGLLGEPIKESGFSLSNEKNRCDPDKAQLQVSVQGSKDRGTVYFWATNNQKQGWLIERLELETKQHPNTRFLLKKPQNYALLSNEGEPDHPGASDSAEESQQPQESLDPQEQAENEAQEQDAPRPPSIQNNPPQQLHQRQGQEPVPHVHTAEG
ncbi:pleckstrin homology-like domain family A member 1 [Drosophila biarmipes]|uniref:pleckstrin homology-like domain family A member 1 n=1 Tax=Drosophila biarmipes TaxID=125945 RepID=UPI0007E85D2D|nr:pleckstrin homology-like domain family A member 1 [Drosophila biarmipes]